MNIIQVIVNNTYELTFLKAVLQVLIAKVLSVTLLWRKKGNFCDTLKGEESL